MTSPLIAPSVAGLEHGRKAARRQAARRRRKNRIVSGVMFVTVAGAAGAAGWFGYQFYLDQRDEQSYDTGPERQRSTEEVIEILEEQPRWNGPGNPNFGVQGERP